METTLIPARKTARDGILAGLQIGYVAVLCGAEGSGKTTVMRDIHAHAGGAFLDMRAMVDRLGLEHPLAIEEAFTKMLRSALETADTIAVDDLHLITDVVDGCTDYPRNGLINAPLTAVLLEAEERGKKLVFATDDCAPSSIRSRAFSWSIKEFSAEDYQSLGRLFLNGAADRLDFAKIHRFAPKLSAHQLRNACRWWAREPEAGTEEFIEYLRAQHMISNVDLAEVQNVDLRDLKGIDDVVESLEAGVVTPFENDALAAELDLKPKRGILLAGPPGTGKTTIGRALAHRLKSKFFLIDGTFIAGSYHFYDEVRKVFDAAKRNAPSIIFVDDCDVLFEDQHDRAGLFRYLLTMLDGLESQSAGRVCLMLTAMDVSVLPPALVRSGRVELWLETRLPDPVARAGILTARIAGLPPELSSADVSLLVPLTHGLSGADLKRIVEDAKIGFAYDRARERPIRAPEAYFETAIGVLRANKHNYVEAETRAKERRRAEE